MAVCAGVLTVDPLATPLPFGVAAAAAVAGVPVQWDLAAGEGSALEGAPHVFVLANGERLTSATDIVRALLPGGDGAAAQRWTEFCAARLSPAPAFPALVAAANEVDAALQGVPFLEGASAAPAAADMVVWAALRDVPAWTKVAAGQGATCPVGADVLRWYRHVAALPAVAASADDVYAAGKRLRTKPKDIANYEIGLPDAVEGRVVTRFPPEPSGYLHIGHAKAAMLNEYFARKYKGALIVRFDDTNPDKECAEFHDAILEDLASLGIAHDRLTYTSDYFPALEGYCRQLLAAGRAYAENATREEMAAQRSSFAPSKNRDTMTGDAGLAIFERMLAGEDDAQQWCIRAKIRFDDANGALRDPVLYRCNRETPHHRTGTRFRAYPTYDFACPVVDSLEGVTHALRTNEYRDRNAQYAWVLDALGLRAPHIWDYSRLNFAHTVLSKRKLLWLVSHGYVSGWDDPRMPTVRGVLRRGLTRDALREYILMQGPSRNVLLLQWDKIWAVNKRVVDPVAPRHVALVSSGDSPLVPLSFSNFDADAPCVRAVPRHKKNAALGTKDTNYAPSVFIEQADAALLHAGMEITLMDWGNVVIDAVEKTPSGAVASVSGTLNVGGDPRKTPLKLTWLAPAPAPLVPATLVEYDHVLSKPKIEDGDELADIARRDTERRTSALGDPALGALRPGDIVQLERKGFYICDAPAPSLVLIAIPDSRDK